MNFFTLTSKIKLKYTIIKSVHTCTLSWCQNFEIRPGMYLLLTVHLGKVTIRLATWKPGLQAIIFTPQL